MFQSTVLQGIVLTLLRLALTVNASAVIAPAAVPELSHPQITPGPKLEVRDVSPQGYSTFWHALSAIDGSTSYSLDGCSAGSTISSSASNWHCCPVGRDCTVYTQCINGILYAADTAVTCATGFICASVFLLETVGDTSAPLTWPGCDASTGVGQFSQYYLFSPGASLVTTTESSSGSSSSSTTSSASSSSSSGGGGGGGSKTNVGAIVGGVVGGLAVVGAIAVGALFFCLRNRRNRHNEAAAAAGASGTLGAPSPQTAMSTVSPNPGTAHQSGYFPHGQQGYSYPHGYAPVQQGYQPQQQHAAYYAPYMAPDPSKTSPGGTTITPSGYSPHPPSGVPDPNAPVELASNPAGNVAEYPQQPHVGAVEVPGSDVPAEKS